MQHFLEFIKYSFLGVVTTIFNFMFFVLLEKIGIYYILANLISYFVSVLLNYILLSLFVYVHCGMDKRKKIKNFIKFLSVRVVVIIIDSGLFYAIVDIMDWNKYVGRIGLSFLLIVATFVVNRVYVFERECGK